MGRMFFVVVVASVCVFIAFVRFFFLGGGGGGRWGVVTELIRQLYDILSLSFSVREGN